jgi:hypothetical protein
LDKDASSKFTDELKDASHKYMAFGAALKEADAASKEKDETVKESKDGALRSWMDYNRDWPLAFVACQPPVPRHD